ncbi:MAG TPA: hypothetical protein PK176_08965 [Acidobacteriota bacterium]|nr:hypothetical protein [Acidobacteriota bacterium]HQM63432.1 hypothetical protein [Acidobacteriota bacterium]
MSNNWKVQRKEGRVSIRVPMTMEFMDEQDTIRSVAIIAENVSRKGFRFSFEDADNLPIEFKVGREYEVNLSFGRKKVKGIIAIVWKNGEMHGVSFVEREKGWVVN